MSRALRHVVLIVVTFGLLGCGAATTSPSTTGSGPASASASATSTAEASAATSSSSAAPAWYDSIPECPRTPLYRCGTLDVPLDRAAPDGEKITLSYYVRPHTDPTNPPLEPVIGIPGGPGFAALGAADVLADGWLTARHDVILVDRRGSGSSAPIDCPDLQDGWESTDAFVAATAACAKQLGVAAERYGSGDSALDIEAIREAHGLDKISLLGFSYGSVVAQAYASRFPERVRAMIVEGGMRPDDPDHRYAWDFGKPAAWARIVARACAEVAACVAAAPDPVGLIARLFEAVRKEPFSGVDAAKGHAADEVALTTLLGTVDNGGPSAQVFLQAAEKALSGSPDALIQLAELQAVFPGDQGPVADYSAGMNQASWCNDEATAWDRSDDVATRREKLAAAIEALPADAFAPVSVGAWLQWLWPDSCIEWPAPDRFEPAIPTGSAPIKVPTLILAGDRDMVVQTMQGEAVHEAIPGSILAVIDGGYHAPTAGPAAGCAQELAAGFLETLTADPNACAPSP